MAIVAPARAILSPTKIPPTALPAKISPAAEVRRSSAPEHSEEHQRPGKIGPLMKCDTDENCAPGRLGADGPVASWDRRDRHPVDRRVASNASGKEIADDRGECAADQT